MAEEEAAGKSRRAVFLGATALACLAVGGLWLWTRPPSGKETDVPPVTAESHTSLGVVDIREAMKAHNAYETLENVRRERQRIETELVLAQRMLVSLSAPQASRTPFEDAARQKEKQVTIRAHGEFMEKLAALEKAKREELKPAYEAARDEINAAYFNEIFNIQLKLDNAKSMRLTEQETQELENRLRALQRERGGRQFDLWQRYEGQIHEYREALAAEHGVNLAELRQKTSEELRAEELRRQAEAQARNAAAIQKNLLDAAKLRERVQEKQQALHNKEQELQAMEEAMLHEIASKAAKLAVRHHLSCIFARAFAPLPRALPEGTGFSEFRLAEGLVNVGAKDLTEELVQEMRGTKASTPTGEPGKNKT